MAWHCCFDLVGVRFWRDYFDTSHSLAKWSDRTYNLVFLGMTWPRFDVGDFRSAERTSGEPDLCSVGFCCIRDFGFVDTNPGAVPAGDQSINTLTPKSEDRL